MGGKKRQRLRVEQCPECGIMSNMVLLKPEVCGCRAREVPDHGGWASSVSLWGASGYGSRGVEARRLVWGEAIVIGPSISCSKGGFLLGNWFFYLNDHFFLAACLDPLGPECWVWGRSRWALNWSKTTSLIRFQYFLLHHTAFHRSEETLHIFVFPEKQNVSSFIFLKGTTLNVIYCSDSEFSGVFFLFPTDRWFALEQLTDWRLYSISSRAPAGHPWERSRRKAFSLILLLLPSFQKD